MSAATTTTKEDKAAAKAAAAADLASVLGVEGLPLADLRGLVDDLTIARAWAGGDIEFGHRKYCVTGPVGKIGSVLVVEDGWEWTGAKTPLHKSYRDLVAEEPPKVEKCKRYERGQPERFGEEPPLKPVEIPPAEALQLIALHVKLTDKGLAGN